MNRIAYFADSHYGFERKQGKLRPVHDIKAHAVMLQVIDDFKPTHIINGGDGLDAGSISHHRRGQPRLTEGGRLAKDAERYRLEVLMPLEGLNARLFYLEGNHCNWIEQLLDEFPGLEGAFSLDSLLKLTEHGWTLKPQGSVLTVGEKLHFLHGDTVRGGQHHAKWAVEAYGRSVMYGHFHTSQRFTKHNALDARDIHRGFAIGCLCQRDPGYGKNVPNKWSQSIALIEEDSKQFQVNEVEILNGRAIYNGRTYHG